MPGGRPRKPTTAKILAGTFRADRDGDAHAAPAEGHPLPPDHLSPAARGFWDRVVPELVSAGIARARDAHQLAAMCEWWARYRLFSDMLDQLPKDGKAMYQVTVLCGIAHTNFDKIASRFGFTPADRAKIGASAATKSAGIQSRRRNA